MVNGQTGVVPLSSLTGSGGQKFDDWQFSVKGDHRFNDRHSISLRYMDDNASSSGTGQLTPTGWFPTRPNRQA